jgi:RNA polymerase sigma factor (sigma-70 family)
MTSHKRLPPAAVGGGNLLGGGRFATTHWSLVLAAGATGSVESNQALATLCELYWYPVYVFVRRQARSADEAADLTQEFFTRLLEKSFLRGVDPERGRFRSFLLACLRHFLSNERDRARTLKRGGQYKLLSLEIETAEERYQLEPHDEMTPDRVFDRRWALTLLDRALSRLREEHRTGGKSETFEALKEFLTGDTDMPYSAVAGALGMSEGAIKVAVHRLRRRFRDLLTDEIAQTVLDPHDVDHELQHLLQAVR